MLEKLYNMDRNLYIIEYKIINEREFQYFNVESIKV
jgi:hypothetical protein